MLVAVLNGKLTEAEQDVYIRQATEQYPISLIEKLILDVQGERVEVRYILHRFRELRKMGGCCIGEELCQAGRDAGYASQYDRVINWVEQFHLYAALHGCYNGVVIQGGASKGGVS